MYSGNHSPPNTDMKKPNVPEDGIQVVPASGLEVVAGPEPNNFGSLPMGRTSSPKDHYGSLPPPYDAQSGVDAEHHYAARRYSDRSLDGAEDAPILVPQPVELPLRKHMVDEETAPIPYRAEDMRREQIAALQSEPSDRRMFGYRRRVFWAICGSAIVFSIVVIAVAFTIRLRNA
ncbi:hypothetical protein HJFPF1_03006 [Paramyrothecium foliicola]|nr:hypothetical protein HJFPF1_03006 [Paramyrothecium foliicola]